MAQGARTALVAAPGFPGLVAVWLLVDAIETTVHGLTRYTDTSPCSRWDKQQDGLSWVALPRRMLLTTLRGGKLCEWQN